MTLLYQIVSTAIIGFACATLGIQYALPSSTLKLFSSENTTLDRIMTETEQSLMGSMSSASTLMVTPFCGYLLDLLGRKRTLILCYLPQLLSWLVLVTINRVEAFIFAMFLCGLSGCNLLVAFVYINEYCDRSIRGGLSSTIVVFNGFGLLTSYLFGGIMEYKTVTYIGLALSAIGLVLLCFLKESPLYLMKKGFEEEAVQSLAFFKGVEPDSEEVIIEMEYIRRVLNTEVESSINPEEEKLKPEENNTKEKLSIKKLLIRSRSSRRALIILVVIYTLSIFQGVNVVQIFAGPLFEAAVPNVTATLTTVLFAAVGVVAGLIGAYLTEKVGRRILLIASSIVTGIFCVIVATNIQFSWAPSMLTAALIYVYTFTYSLGAGTVPYVLTGEVFLPEIKGFATTLCIEWSFLSNFTIIYMFVPLFNAYGLGPLFYLFGGMSFLTALFSFIYLPETKNLPVDIKGFATTLCIEWSFLSNFTIIYMFVPLFNAYGLGPLFYLFGGMSFLTALFSFIYLPETKNLPVDIKGFATTLCIEWSFLSNFTIIYMFVPLFNAYGLGPLFYLFGGMSFLTALFSFIYLPETKNLPVDVIQTKFL